MFHISVHVASTIDLKTGKALMALVKTYFDQVSKDDGCTVPTEVIQTIQGPGDNFERKVSICVLTDNGNWVMRRYGQSFMSKLTKELPTLKGELSLWITKSDHTFG